jgi:hypothetical protein
MAKIPYSTRLDPELLDAIRQQAKIRKRTVNSMIGVLCEYGLQYLSDAVVEPIPMIRNNNIESNAVN